MENLVGLSDYSGFGADVFYQDESLTVQDLRKAMSAGDGGAGRDALDSATAGSIQPAITESLEANLKKLTLRREELKIWRAFRMSPAYALAEEFLQLVDIGSERGGFHDEFDLPEQEDTTYRRRSEQVKYLGNTRAISHQAQLVRTRLGDVVQREVDNGTLWILRKLNRALIYGDSKIVPAEFNGLYAQHSAYGQDKTWSSVAEYYDSDFVIDMRGASITQKDFFDAAEVIDENHGYANTIYGPNAVITDLSKDYIDKQRIILNSNSSQIIGGAIPKMIPTPYGDVGLGIDKFLKQTPARYTGDAATSSKAPANPVPDGSNPATAVTDAAGTKFADFDGDYFYAVSAVNKYGESAIVQLGSGAITVAADESVDLIWAAGSGVYATTGYRVYRSTVDPAGAIGVTPMYPLFDVSLAELAAGFDGGAATKVRDRNRFLPNTNQAFIWEDGTEVTEFKQLAPLMRMDLARLDPTMRFMLLMYGTPQLYNPKRVVRFINIGPFVPAS